VRRNAFRAAKNLSKLGIKNPWSILFRSVSWEIRKIAKLNSENELRNWLSERSSEEFRWKLITYKNQLY
ncbi:MAG: hypothetical protein QXH80_02495, partial [Candidatus Nanoarchaeia archaeon]